MYLCVCVCVYVCVCICVCVVLSAHRMSHVSMLQLLELRERFAKSQEASAAVRPSANAVSGSDADSERESHAALVRDLQRQIREVGP